MYIMRYIRKLRFVVPAILLVQFVQSQNIDPVKINVDATTVLSGLQPFWASQIIHPTEFLLTGWGKELLNTMTENGAALQYVRIYNQPESAIRVSANGEISYDWSRFDEMAEMILSTGNKLKIVFFGMPTELAAYPESVKKRPYGGLVCISPPKDYRQWEKLCADFTRHVINKYGIAKVKEWTFRCWNEPDLRSFWHRADLNEYQKLYDFFAKGVKSVHPEIRIGGPGLASTRTYNEPQNFRFFCNHVANGKNHATGEIGSPIDFLSIHTYGGSSGAGGPGRQYPEVDYLMEQQIRLADIRDEYPVLKRVPIHVEEWGETSGGTTGISARPTADVRNSQYGAAFFTSWVGRHIKMRQENDRKFESFTFCASGYETIPEADFMGYRTLHTKNGFHKPILNAYKLLSRLGTELVGITNNELNEHVSAFATRDSTRITIVVTNYQHDKIDNDGITYQLNMDIKTHWNSNSNLTLRHWRIDENHSNSYTAFKKEGSPKLPNPLQVDAIKKRMELEMLKSPELVTTKELSNIVFQLPCNAVSLIEIIKN
jgi:xylan 1,4-beta-xylosidase